MKTTLFLKRIDLFVQLLALAIPILLACLHCDFCYLFMCYITLGVTQLVSCIINYATFNPNYRHNDRLRYQYMVCIILALLLLLKLVPALYFIFIGVAVVSPFMAADYLRITYLETRFIKSLMNRDQFTRI